jgi:hypothetical protein
LGGAHIIAADTNFAFSKLNEKVLESGDVTAGNFVGHQHATADIGGFKIEGVAGSKGFTIDDFSFGGFAVPEPGMWAFLMAGLAALGFGVRKNSGGGAKQPLLGAGCLLHQFAESTCLAAAVLDHLRGGG